MEQYLNMDKNLQRHIDTSPCARVTMQSEPNYIKGQGKLSTISYFFTYYCPFLPFWLACIFFTHLFFPVGTSLLSIVTSAGNLAKWLKVEENLMSGYESARPAPRACPSEESQVMKERSKGLQTNLSLI